MLKAGAPIGRKFWQACERSGLRLSQWAFRFHGSATIRAGGFWQGHGERAGGRCWFRSSLVGTPGPRFSVSDEGFRNGSRVIMPFKSSLIRAREGTGKGTMLMNQQVGVYADFSKKRRTGGHENRWSPDIQTRSSERGPGTVACWSAPFGGMAWVFLWPATRARL